MLGINMSVWSTRSDSISTGVLFKRAPQARTQLAANLSTAVTTVLRAKHRLAFVGLYVVMVLMYVRPQEVMPEVFGGLPMAKIATIATILIYVFSKLSAGEKLITWPLEMKMVALIWALGLIFLPFAVSPQDSFDVLFDPFIKTVIIFIMLINLVDTPKRLHLLLHILVVCQLLYAISAIKTFLEGGYSESASFHYRIQGWGTLFANPNDLASVLTVMLPFAVVFGLTRRGWVRLFYFACAGVAAVAILCTFSRSGFIGLVLSVGVIVWKLSGGRRVRVWLAVLVVVGVLSLAMPGKYVTRLATIFNPQTDTTHSAQERQEVLRRAATLAVSRSVVGVGMGNFHIYSIREMKAHNSYLETASELGVVGLIAFLILIFTPIRSLRRIQRETKAGGSGPERELFITSVCFQASFVAYIIYSFFGSIQYFNFLYFGVAYVVAFQRIYAAAASAKAGTAESTGLTGGTLWRPQRVRQLQLTEGSR